MVFGGPYYVQNRQQMDKEALGLFNSDSTYLSILVLPLLLLLLQLLLFHYYEL